MLRDGFEYSEAHYNEAILYMEQKWQRKLTLHECHLLRWVYSFARLQEMYSYYEGWSIDDALVRLQDTYINNK